MNVAWIERSEIQDGLSIARDSRVSLALEPGYDARAFAVSRRSLFGEGRGSVA